jgi:uncharacterized protein YbaR (Trm112 family)
LPDVIDPFLLELLACPRCEDRPPLTLEDGRLVCAKCQSAYPIVDDIPHLLPEDAIALPEVRKNDGR